MQPNKDIAYPNPPIVPNAPNATVELQKNTIKDNKKDINISVTTKSDVSPIGIYTEVIPNAPIRGTSIAAFLKSQQEKEMPFFPASALGWYVLRYVCDSWDITYTEDTEQDKSWTLRTLLFTRLVFLVVPFLALVDFVINMMITTTFVPLLYLWCCYPFKDNVKLARAKEPYSCCLLHEACDPMLRCYSSFILLLSTPFLFFGIFRPQYVANCLTRLADGHIDGYLYLDQKFCKSCLCCFCCESKRSKHAFGIFYRHRHTGEII